MQYGVRYSGRKLPSDAALDERPQRGVGAGGALGELQVVRRQHGQQHPAAPVQRRDRQGRGRVPVHGITTYVAQR